MPQGVVSRDVRKHDEDEDDDGGIGRGRLMDKKRGKGKGRGIISGISVPYCKWLIAPSSSGAAAAGAGGGGGGGGGSSGEAREEEDGKSSLPPGYTFDKVRRDELKLTMSRTEIPKTEETLAQLGNVAVRYTPASTDTATTTSSTTSTSTATTTSSTTAPTTSTAKTAPAPRTTLTAWAFLSPDGSLTSLHVTPPHRRQGLAKAVSRRLLQRLADDASAMGFRPVAGYDGNNNNNNNNNSREGRRGEEEGWAHSDVAAGNEESAGVARGVGGKEGWVVRWVGVDLRAVVEGGGGDEMKVCEERGRKGGKFGSGESLVVDTSMGGSGRH